MSKNRFIVQIQIQRDSSDIKQVTCTCRKYETMKDKVFVISFYNLRSYPVDIITNLRFNINSSVCSIQEISITNFYRHERRTASDTSVVQRKKISTEFQCQVTRGRNRENSFNECSETERIITRIISNHFHYA